MGASTPDEAVGRLLKMWHLESKPGVLTASLLMLGAVEATLGFLWPGLRVFVAAQLGLMLIVIFVVALVDSGKMWDSRLFDNLYRPPGTFDDSGRKLPSGRFLQRERPRAGIFPFPSGLVLTTARERAAKAIPCSIQGLYEASRDYLSRLPDGSERLTEADEPLELAKGLRALLAPLVVLFGVGVGLAAGAYVTDGGNWTTWAAVAGAALLLWVVFAYVFVHRRYEHLVHLYQEVEQAASTPT